MFNFPLSTLETPMRTRILTFTLFDNHKIVSDPDNTITITEDLAIPGLAEAIAQAESMSLVVSTVGAPAANKLGWNVKLVAGYDGRHEATAFVVGPTGGSGYITANGPTRYAEVNDLTKFLLTIRAQLYYQSQVAGSFSAVVSATLIVRCYGV